MFTLNKYVDSLLELIINEESSKKRKEIVEAWFKMLKRHHRDLEGKKILKILDEKIVEYERRAQVTVSDEKEKRSIEKFFEKRDIPVDIEIKPDIFGGARIVWDNILVDNTINSQLNKLREKIIGNN